MPNPNLPINAQYNTYVGARYVPKFANPIEWDNTKQYEPLTIVTYQGNSYTSTTFVPIGTAITNTTYWAPTGNYNAQVEQYRQEVLAFNDRITDLENYNENLNAVNLLYLGGDNTGQNDNSELINNITKNYPIYLPPGSYKISEKINLNNPIYGAIPTNIRAGSKIISEVNSDDLFVCTTNDIVIANLTITCSGYETNIINLSHNTQNYSLIKNVSIYNLGNVGIKINPTYSISRYAIIDCVGIYSQYIDKETQTGIIINNAPDSRVINTNIMGAVKGVIVNSDSCQLSNMHIWCGTAGSASPMTPSRWLKTCPLTVNGNIKLNVENIYLDTAYIYLNIPNAANVHINNINTWVDTSFASGNIGQLLSTNEGMPHVFIDNGTICLNTAAIESFSNSALKCYNVNVITPPNQYIGNVLWSSFNSADGIFATTNNLYQEVARCYQRYGGYAECTIIYDNNAVKISVDGNTIKKTTLNGTLSIWYKINPLSQGKNYIIYIKGTGLGGSVSYRYGNNNCSFYNLGIIKNSNTMQPYAVNTQDSTVGLTLLNDENA